MPGSCLLTQPAKTGFIQRWQALLTPIRYDFMWHRFPVHEKTQLWDCHAWQQPNPEKPLSTYIYVSFRNITLYYQLLTDLSSCRTAFYPYLESLPEGINILDRQLRIQQNNAASRQLQLMGHCPYHSLHEQEDACDPEGDQACCPAQEAMISQDLVAREQQFSDEQGRQRWLEIFAYPRFAEGNVMGAVELVRDITMRKHAENHIHQLAYTDQLTGLPNRNQFWQTLQQELATLRQTPSQGVVCFIDLDKFNKVNDSIGHRYGDYLLKAIAERLGEKLEHNGTLARAGGDEFFLLLPRLAHERQLENLLETIINAFRQPFVIQNHNLHITPSIGVTRYPQDGTSPDQLLRNADLAMHQAKKKHGNGYRYFSRRHQHEIKRRFQLEHLFSEALQQQQFYLLYQPKVNPHSECISGLEALLRWRNPQLGDISPAKFIPIAEESGFIIELGHWVRQQALAQLQIWHNAGLRPVPIAVNVSGRELEQPDFVDRLTTLLQPFQQFTPFLELEITESTLMEDAPQTQRLLLQLAQLGLRVSMDDFGTGYSSLNYLKHFKLHQLKIDRSFVRDIPANENDQTIVKTILLMAQSLGLEVVAEGVETPEQLRFFRHQHCQHIQGFLYFRPLPVEQITTLLQSQLDEPRCQKCSKRRLTGT